jgi:hypothetical protein
MIVCPNKRGCTNEFYSVVSIVYYICLSYPYLDSNRSVWCVTSTGCRLAGSALGKKGKRAESVGQEAAEEFIRNWESQSCVDE